jgi:hypothetical protein
VLGLVAPDHHGEERRLPIPPAGDGHPERRAGDPAFAVAEFGLVGEVAKGCLTAASVMLLPSSGCLVGRSALPLDRGNGGRLACSRLPGASCEPTKSADSLTQVAEHARLGCRTWLGEWLAAGGRACHHRPARSLHPGRGGRSRLPPRGPPAARPGQPRPGARLDALVNRPSGHAPDELSSARPTCDR